MKNKREGTGVCRDSLRLRCKSDALEGEREGSKIEQEDPQTAVKL